ncbi:MAG: DUF1553 domain-containing protein [Phycisphaeraceae bacterium]
MTGFNSILRLSLASAVGISFLAAPGVAADPAAAQGPVFSRHIVPLFSKLGCNAGQCHGAVQGQNGFRLSLFAADPGFDHQSILREHGGRRIDPLNADQSLLLRKGLATIPHKGGQRIAPGRWEHEFLRAWLAGGAPLDNLESSRVTTLIVTPAQKTLKVGDSYDLRVEARFADGSSEEVTRFCLFEVLDQDIATVTADGKVMVKAAGDTAIIARYGAEPALAMVEAPRQGSEPLPDVKPANFIDEHILAKLRRMNVPPSDLCDDATFLRRVSLDVTGSLPPPEEVRAFLVDKSADKRAKKIEEMLARPGYAALWATKFCDLLRASGFDGNFAMHEAAENRRFYEWIRARLDENTPYDELVERILTATSDDGRSHEDWLVESMALGEENAKQSPDLPLYLKRRTLDLYWQRKESTGLKGTLQVAHQFLGLRLECAQCHRHPHDTWKQDDLLSFANFFMRVKGAAYPDKKTLPPKYGDMLKSIPEEAKKLREEAKKLSEKAKDKSVAETEREKMKQQAAELDVKARGMENGTKRFGVDIRHQADKISYASMTSPLGTQKSEKFRLLGQSEVMKVAKEQDPRKIVADWMRQPDNPWFARAIVNRVWAHYFGRGLVDPPDQLSSLNPPSHPELLKALADGLIASRFDLKWLHRTILSSRAYQTTSVPTTANRADRRNYSYFYLRRLPAEQIVDAINHATAGSETFPAKLYLPANAKAMEVAGVTTAEDARASVTYPFQIFGRPVRNAQVQCDCERESNPTIVQTLYLANHPRVREKIASPEGRVAQVMEQEKDAAKQVELIYLWILSRPPEADELKTCLDYMKESESPKRGLEDVMWSLLNTREFLMNH